MEFLQRGIVKAVQELAFLFHRALLQRNCPFDKILLAMIMSLAEFSAILVEDVPDFSYQITLICFRLDCQRMILINQGRPYLLSMSYSSTVLLFQLLGSFDKLLLLMLSLPKMVEHLGSVLQSGFLQLLSPRKLFLVGYLFVLLQLLRELIQIVWSFLFKVRQQLFHLL